MKDYQFTISKKADIMNDVECEVYISELLKRKKLIHDINVTCKMTPFTEDAHGVMMSKEDNDVHIEQMLYVQKQTGINISLVFNNIYVPNDEETLKVFIKNFSDYYCRGVRNITLPHILWMKLNILQQEFPNLFVKSTVLRRVRNAQEFWNYAMAGFDCVNIDRLLYRNVDVLKDIKRAQSKFFELYGRYVLISMVIDENCIGYCPFWEEHYQYSMTSSKCKNPYTNKEGFNVVPGFSGCKERNNISLQRVNLIGFYEDMHKVFDNIDILKIGGRRFKVDEFKMIDSIMNTSLICHPLLHRILVRGKPQELELIDAWRKKTKNCGYQCWDCNLCNKVESLIMNSKIQEWKYSNKK